MGVILLGAILLWVNVLRLLLLGLRHIKVRLLEARLLGIRLLEVRLLRVRLLVSPFLICDDFLSKRDSGYRGKKGDYIAFDIPEKVHMDIPAKRYIEGVGTIGDAEVCITYVN